MGRTTKNLTGERFGYLTVVEKAEGLHGRYYNWLCHCDCGNEIIVSTKNLNGHRTTHCGCQLIIRRNLQLMQKDITEKKFGALTAIKMMEKTDTGEPLWECKCECGNSVTVSCRKLLRDKAKDCGCGMGKKPHYKDITGKRKGILTALYPTLLKDKRGSVIWHCRCECGNEIDITEDDFVYGNYVSCGCVKQRNLEAFPPPGTLNFVDGTCVEWIANRKKRSDNTSGFRGVYKCKDERYSVSIGLQSKRYNLGRYDTFEEAVSIRLRVEKCLHDGFLSSWQIWQEKATTDKQWAISNPFFFNVKKSQRTFRISSTVTEQEVFRY